MDLDTVRSRIERQIAGGNGTRQCTQCLAARRRDAKPGEIARRDRLSPWKQMREGGVGDLDDVAMGSHEP